MMGIIITALGGLCIGSFLNVLIYRLPRGQSILFPGSRCPSCGMNLPAQDLLPVMGFILLKGRCRLCRSPINVRYPLVEIITAACFLGIYSMYGLSLQGAGGMVLTGILLCSSFIDLDYGIIPDQLTYPGLVLGVIPAYFTGEIISGLSGALIFGGILYTAGVLSRGGMGMGDVKLALVIGIFCGMGNAFLAYLITSISAGIYAVILLATHRADKKTAVKYAPFLSLGGYSAYVFGDEILKIYGRCLGL